MRAASWLVFENLVGEGVVEVLAEKPEYTRVPREHFRVVLQRCRNRLGHTGLRFQIRTEEFGTRLIVEGIRESVGDFPLRKPHPVVLIGLAISKFLTKQNLRLHQHRGQHRLSRGNVACLGLGLFVEREKPGQFLFRRLTPQHELKGKGDRALHLVVFGLGIDHQLFEHLVLRLRPRHRLDDLLRIAQKRRGRRFVDPIWCREVVKLGASDLAQSAPGQASRSLAQPWQGGIVNLRP